MLKNAIRTLLSPSTINFAQFVPTAIADRYKAVSAHRLWENKRNDCENFPVVWAGVPDSAKPNIKNVLEFGSNWGGNLKTFLDQTPDGRATGVDINPTVKEMEQTNSRYTGIVGNQNALEQFADNQFDLAFTISVLDHIPGERVIAKAVQQLSRIAKLTILVEPYIEGWNQDISGMSWGDVVNVPGLSDRLREPPYSVQDRLHKLFAAHSYAWDYDAMLNALPVQWTKAHTPLHAQSLGPFYHTYHITRR